MLKGVGPTVVLALAILVAPLTADGQQPAKVYRIGVLASAPPTTPEVSRLWGAFRQGLGERGWVEGQNVVIESRWSEGQVERFPALAAEIVRLNVDLIFAVGTAGALAAKQATGVIPIVMAYVGDPVEQGLVASLARPGGNATGLSLVSSELAGKRIELLQELVPKLARVAVLLNPANASNALQLREAEAASRTRRIHVQALEVRAPDDLERAFRAAVQDRAGALIVLDDPFLAAQRTGVSALASRHRLPAMYGFGANVEAGGLIAYGPSIADQLRRVAAYVEKILKGTVPGDLPVEQPTKFELVINRKTAKALGIKIPQSILLRADRVIE